MITLLENFFYDPEHNYISWVFNIISDKHTASLLNKNVNSSL